MVVEGAQQADAVSFFSCARVQAVAEPAMMHASLSSSVKAGLKEVFCKQQVSHVTSSFVLQFVHAVRTVASSVNKAFLELSINGMAPSQKQHHMLHETRL